VIRIHRIVREQIPFQPIETVDGVLLLPGTPQFFETIFMAPLKSSVPPPDQSVVLFLAKNNIDVWGMDYGSSFIPEKTTDFSVLKGWGVDKDAQHAETALTIARQIRTRTGLGASSAYRSGWVRGWGARDGLGRLHLLGYSYGVYIAYAVAGAETQKPAGMRNIKGIIPVDSTFKFEEASRRATACKNAATYMAQLDAGVYQIGPGLGYQLGDLARSAPDGPSSLYPGLTNFQAALDRGISGGIVAGVRDASGKPLDLLYTDAWLFVDLLRAGVPYRPQQSAFDSSAVQCDDPQVADVKFDDHLREIAVPIYYVGRSTLGYYAATLTSSKDISSLIVTKPAFFGACKKLTGSACQK